MHNITRLILKMIDVYKYLSGADPGMKKRGGTLLLAGDSVHSAPSIGSGGMTPQEILALSEAKSPTHVRAGSGSRGPIYARAYEATLS